MGTILGIDFVTLLPAITKTGSAGFVLALFLGLAQVINAWRGGNVSKAKEEDLNAKLEDLQRECDQVTEKYELLEKRHARIKRKYHATIFQRDQARVYSEYLELAYGHEPTRIWPWDTQAQLAEEDDEEEEEED